MILFAFAVNIISCKKKSEDIYSCNSVINEKVKKSRTENQNITRAELASKGLDEQFAIFRSLTSENKLRIYKEKIDLLLSTNNYSSIELQYLNSVRNSTSSSVYDLDVDAREELNTYHYNYQKNTLGWSELDIVSSLETWLTENELIILQKQLPNGGGGTPPTPDCHCRKDIWCDFSGTTGYDCDWGGCKVTSGCGWLSGSDCKGRCKL